MPLYEYRKNATNTVTVPAHIRQKVICGTASVFEHIISLLRERAAAARPVKAAIDGWYGVDWAALKSGLLAAAKTKELSLEIVCTAELYQPAAAIDEYRQPFVTNDPSFGRVNGQGVLEDILDSAKVAALKTRLNGGTGRSPTDVLMVIGPGAAGPALAGAYDLRFYADFTMQPLLWQMWDGELVTFGRTTPTADYNWKQYYYCDFYLLLRQKKQALARMDYYLEAVDAQNLKLVSAAAYNMIIDELVKGPIKQVKIAQPGPWGSYRFKQIYGEIPGLENMAWNELAGIELSILVDIGAHAVLNIPCQNIMQRPAQMVGEYVHQTYPDLLPLQVWLDDGYFAEPVPYERSSMPIHNHPDTEYVKRNFSEPLGRYETYYIVEAYHDAGTMMGFKEDADLEEYERLCRDSDNRKVFDWQKFIRRWATNVGDLFLIPPGTEHGHGGNQMILEMDTGPSVAGTEYSFFTYDFARHTWDDQVKTMTAPPMRMHLEHSFRNNKWRREKYVQEHLRARPVVVRGDGDTRMDRFTTLPEMPFEIERFVFNKPMAHSTEGRYLQIPTLTVGKSIIIRSKRRPERQTSLDFLQACLIPAGFGDYEFISPDGSQCTVVMIRLKRA
jgi:mannose-6-phosphate isomerase class I